MVTSMYLLFFFFSSRRRHTRLQGDWSSDVCSSDLAAVVDDREHELRRDRDVAAPDLVLERDRERAGRDIPRDLDPERHAASIGPDRKSVGEGKRVDLGGRRIIKKKKKKNRLRD